MSYKPILIVAGEPNSIFLEIFFKSIKKKKINSPIILICSKKLLIKQMQYLKYNFSIKEININNNFDKLDNKFINVINVEYLFKKPFEKISNKSNNYITACFNLAEKLIKKRKIDKFINGPIEKKSLLKKRYPGITELLAKKFNSKNYAMLIYNKKISVCPLTTHIPIKFVPQKITKRLIINKIILIKNFFQKVLKKNPKIAITGLNPHCESTHKFNEDEKIIAPTIGILKKKKILVNGPFSADTIFLKQNRKKFDVVVGMYHDQVLAPLKTLFEYDAINITIGLPVIRISPDHGPNKGMIGKNVSNPLSLIRALEFLDKK